VHWCTAHHLQPWTPVTPGAARGPTDLANLAPLCSTHHHLAHEGGWTLTRGPDGVLTARPPGTAPPPDRPSPDREPPDRGGDYDHDDHDDHGTAGALGDEPEAEHGGGP
jgi:hypothetical protein